jgi:hypothetical protein
MHAGSALAEPASAAWSMPRSNYLNPAQPARVQQSVLHVSATRVQSMHPHATEQAMMMSLCLTEPHEESTLGSRKARETARVS